MEEELENLESTNQTLILKERVSNQELQDARKEALEVRVNYIFFIYPF